MAWGSPFALGDSRTSVEWEPAAGEVSVATGTCASRAAWAPRTGAHSRTLPQDPGGCLPRVLSSISQQARVASTRKPPLDTNEHPACLPDRAVATPGAQMVQQSSHPGILWPACYLSSRVGCAATLGCPGLDDLWLSSEPKV